MSTFESETDRSKAQGAADKELGERLKTFRVKKLGLSQPELADLLGVRRQTVASWEQGQTSPDVRNLMTLRTIAQQKEIMDFSLSEMLGEYGADAARSPIESTIRFLEACNVLGIRGAYPDRAKALEALYPFLERETNSIRIVASSFTGVVRIASPRVSELLRQKVKKVRDFRIMMTHPDIASLREKQEGREAGYILQEIRESLFKLTGDWEVPEASIRFYRGAPTVFAIFVTDRALLNPYALETEAFKTLTLEVAPTPFNENVYTQFSVNHFDRPWGGPSSVPVREFLNAIRDGTRNDKVANQPKSSQKIQTNTRK